MTYWIQLSPTLVHYNYCVSNDIAANGSNLFFGTQNHPQSDPMDMDGPWPLLAFIRNAQNPNVVTFCIYTLEGIHIDSEGFDPLKDTGGALNLTSQARTDLVELLLKQAEQLTTNDKSAEKMFALLEEDRLSYFHINTEYYPHMLREFYYQVYDPLSQSSENYVTLLGFSTSMSRLSIPSNLYFRLGHFSLGQLAKPTFEPFGHSLPHINLTASGMRELAFLLASRFSEKE